MKLQIFKISRKGGLMRKLLVVFLTLCIFTCVFGANLYAKKKAQVKKFYIYADKNSPANHFIPSGWMGDTGDLKFNDQATEEQFSGANSIKIAYSAQKSRGQGWAGIYWQSSQNNWGERDTGLDLSGFNKLSFSAKGAQGGEIITTVKAGGITVNPTTGEPISFPDTLNVENGPMRLTNEWQEYYVNLVGEDLSSVNGGFALILNADQSDGEQTIYLDDIAYVYDPELQKEDVRVTLPFYVYADNGSLDNHFIPSGWMPPTAPRDLKMNNNWKNYPFSGESCIRISYQNNSGTRWAGVHWQNPANNWGGVPNSGFDLQHATKLTFWARGDKGGEVVTEFKVGGISSGEYIDSDSAGIGPVQLEKEWKKYEIDLTGRDLSYIIGGFAWATNIDVNDPEGIVFYLDEIRYEAE